MVGEPELDTPGDDSRGVAAGPRVAANLRAVRAVRAVQASGRPPTPTQVAALRGWCGWGAAAGLFDTASGSFAQARAELVGLLSPGEYRAAERTTLTAHYTDPAIATVMWRTLTGLGFAGGPVLEPGCGAGVFLGSAPAGAAMVGVELDPVTAGIAAVLHPGARVLTGSFAEVVFPTGSFAGVIGNVPFGSTRLYDPVHNRGQRLSVHNHFLVKAVDLLAPGGVLVALTSRYTMDAANPYARTVLAGQADLLGAVRLPSRTHRHTAGTDVVTDLLVLRRRDLGETPEARPGWISSGEVDLPGGRQSINTYFLAHPDQVLGRIRVGDGMYGANTLLVDPDERQALDEALSRACHRIVDEHASPDRPGSPRATPTTAAARLGHAAAPAGSFPTTPTAADGRLAVAHGQVVTVTGQGSVPFPVPAAHLAEVRALIALRETVTALLDAESTDVSDTGERSALRGQLATRYAAYVDRWGPINRFTLARTGRTDEHGQDVMRRVTPRAWSLFRVDPHAWTVAALEVFDEASQTAAPADILHRRVVYAREPVRVTESVDDALAVCLDALGHPDLDMIGRLLRVDAAEARQRLAERVFDLPDGSGVVTAAEYLSGNVRVKLYQAQAALTGTDVAPGEARWQVNVDALTRVLPPQLGPAEIQVGLGAVWVPEQDVQAFLAEILQDPSVRVEHPGGSIWGVSGDRHSTWATSTWGTDRMDAVSIAGHLLEQSTIVIRDEVDTLSGLRLVTNADATAAAHEKAALMSERFAEWVWQDPARAERLAGVYNERFNAITLRSYPSDHLRLPGLSATFTPMPHQRQAVARMIAEPAVGLFHEVGAGKTASMVMGAWELRRLGLVRKPAIVVPNHMLAQFAREFVQLYPQARVLAAGSEDLSAPRRRAFVARVATGDWDAVILTRTAFAALPVSRAAQQAYLDAQADTLHTQLERAQASGAGRSLTVKRIQRRLQGEQERLKRALDVTRDRGVTWEQTGIDYLIVDEMHDYKNLRLASNIQGVGIEGSKRATDLDMKLSLLRARHGARVITGATATPIANTVAEVYTMQRYLRPDLLHEAGLTDFDSWAGTFGRTVTEIELAPAGAGNYRLATRFARFTNVPELLRMWHACADVKTADELHLHTPTVAARPDGSHAPETVLVTPTPELLAYVADLGQRAERVTARQVDPSVDNMLKITGDGRKAALDMHLVTSGASPQEAELPSKVAVAAARIARIWREHTAALYLTPEGMSHPRPGGLQIVFCDLGTPSRDGRWSVYGQLRDELVGHGMDPTRIRFVHSAGTDAEKARLFAACRDGHVDVVVGSTSKLGVGTNIQTRVVAMHHLDCPWRPADIAQRDGRGIRQGNQNPQVAILRYATERSFDGYCWQTVERKAKFIAQVMRGRLDVREIEDVGDTALSFAEVKALACGDPLILDQAKAQADLTRLERLERAHHRAQSHAGYTLRVLTREHTDLTAAIPRYQHALTQRTDTRADAFRATIHPPGQATRTVTERAAAADLLRESIHTVAAGLPRDGGRRSVTGLVNLGGHAFDLHLQTTPMGQTHAALTVHGLPDESVGVDTDTLAGDGHGLVSRLENRLTGLDRALTDRSRRLAVLDTEIANTQHTQQALFPYHQALADAREHLAAVTSQLQAKTTPPPAEPREPQPSPKRPDGLTHPGQPPGGHPARVSRSHPGHAHDEPATPRR